MMLSATLESFHNVMVYLEDKYSFPKLSAIEWRPINTIDVNDEENAKKLFTLLDKLEDLDDVQTVASNFNIDEELLKGNPVTENLILGIDPGLKNTGWELLIVLRIRNLIYLMV